MNLSDNIIGDSGLETVATLLEETVNLTTLNLENNRVSDVGVRHICQGWCRLFMCEPHFVPRAEELEIHCKEFW
jgi:Ran GTPase-activating protein (RanGAP) involved in mRNA processing and transport